jgi:hypothetical protein
LSWHKNFDTRGAWTKGGGVQLPLGLNGRGASRLLSAQVRSPIPPPSNLRHQKWI